MIAIRILWPDHKTNNIDRLVILRIKINWICQNGDDTNGARQIVMHGMGNCNAAANGGAANTLAVQHEIKKISLAKPR